MKFELNSHVLIAHWIPGFIFVMAIRPMVLGGTSPLFKSLIGSDAPGGEAIVALALAVAAFLAGEILDASRDLLEHLWDRFQAVEWDFFTDAAPEEIEKLKTSCFTYYAFDSNISLAFAVLLLTNYFTHLLGSGLSGLVSVVVFFLIFLLFVVNAWTLRKQIAHRTKRWVEPPLNTQ